MAMNTCIASHIYMYTYRYGNGNMNVCAICPVASCPWTAWTGAKPHSASSKKRPVTFVCGVAPKMAKPRACLPLDAAHIAFATAQLIQQWRFLAYVPQVLVETPNVQSVK